jgi:hypothetical protein
MVSFLWFFVLDVDEEEDDDDGCAKRTVFVVSLVASIL